MRKHHSRLHRSRRQDRSGRHGVIRMTVGLAAAAAGSMTLSFTGPTAVGADTAQAYWVAAHGGTVTAFDGAPSLGSPGPSGHPIVAIAPTADRGGYWVADSAGHVSSFGDASSHGSAPGRLDPPHRGHGRHP